jgi:hypothetical protein
MTPARDPLLRRALRYIAQSRNGMLIAAGHETRAQRELIAQGLVERNDHGPGYCRLMLSAPGRAEIERIGLLEVET